MLTKHEKQKIKEANIALLSIGDEIILVGFAKYLGKYRNTYSRAEITNIKDDIIYAKTRHGFKFFILKEHCSITQ